MIHLDSRLQAVAEFIKPGRTVADIGTDHGYLAIFLVQSGRSPHVIATDKNEGPYLAACRSIQGTGMEEDCIEVRLGEGLQPILPGETAVLCIAGMGGQLIKQILLDAPKVTDATEQLVLQPMNGTRELREWLYANGWHLTNESLAEADGRIYEILSAEKGRRDMPEDILLEIGPCLIEKKAPLLHRLIENRLTQVRKAAEGMAQSPQARKSKKYLEFKKRIQELEGLL